MAEHFLLRDRYKESFLYEDLNPTPVKIESARLVLENGFLGLCIVVDYGGSGQGYRIPLSHPGCSEVLTAIFSLFGIDSIEKLKGRYANALLDREPPIGIVIGLANLEPDGHWFILQEDISKWVTALPLIKKHRESVS